MKSVLDWMNELDAKEFRIAFWEKYGVIPVIDTTDDYEREVGA